MMIKERPIIFSGEMVRAILDHRKTMTRRVVKGGFPNAGYCAKLPPYRPGEVYNNGDEIWQGPLCPFGNVGDRLWVRESFRHYANRFSGGQGFGLLEYLADGFHADKPSDSLPQLESTDAYWYKRRPSIHMPRWASRITLEITNVRVERVQNITDEDAIAEGIRVDDCNHAIRPNDDVAWGAARGCFAELWDKINKKHPWNSNPWVWVISFEALKND